MVSRISRLSAIRKAGRWQRGGQEWHFHLLSPGCLFNPTKTHELFLESKRGAFVVKSHRSLTGIGRVLSHLLHSSRLRVSVSPRNPTMSKLLDRVEHLTSKRIKWHHHVLFPHCMFNKRWGKWTIAFEDPLNNKITEVVYPNYPEADVAKLEKAFYLQKAK